MSRSAPVILLAVLLTACGGQGNVSQASPTPAASSPSPSPSPSASPTPALAAYAVLATPNTSADYSVTLIDAQGNHAGTATAKGWNGSLTCAGVATALLPPLVSASNSKVYFEDSAGVVHFLAPDGATGKATTVPVGSARRSIFSVSPDDKRIAVVVSDFGANKATIKVYVEDLNGGGHHVQIFTSSGPTSLWPIGWHAGNLVLAKVPACIQGSNFGCCGPTELHVVNPANGARRFTIGGSVCIVSGPSTPFGTPCLTSSNVARILDWAGVTTRTVQLPFKRLTYLSPDGQHLAYQTDGGTIVGGQTGPLQMGVCGWIDNSHILDGGDFTGGGTQAHIGDITTGAVAPIPFTGLCAGRIPGGL